MSVVVPVYNPGQEIEACIESLRAQSLPASAFEVLFVDDGSTDGTSERLDAVAAVDANVRVIHLAASGAPGRPRNTGLDAARGRYVYFVDSDDAIAPTALERLTDEADRTRADIVLGKYASASLPRGQAMFGRNRRRMTLRSTPALVDSSLAPNKLFLVAFLRAEGIRFPEGWRLMEDQHFVLQAYFRARRISLLADQTYYYFRRRDAGGHLSAAPLDPVADIDHLRTILDMVEAESEPGVLRDRVIRRLYRAEILARLADAEYAALDGTYRHQLFEGASRLAVERIDPSIDAGLNAIVRLRSRLLREGREDALLELARRTAAVGLVAPVREARWHHGQIRIVFEARLADRASGAPVTVSDRGGVRYLDPRLTEGIADDGVRVDDELAAVRGNIQLREHRTAAEWVIPTRLSLAFERRGPAGSGVRVPVVHGEAYVDPQRVGPGDLNLDPGRWAMRLRLNLLGIDQRTALVASEDQLPLQPAILGDPPLLVAPVSDEGLWLDVSRADDDASAGRSIGANADGAQGRRITVPLPIASHIGLRPLPAVLMATAETVAERWPAVARHQFGGLVLDAWPRSIAEGPVTLTALVAGCDGEVAIGRAILTDGAVRLETQSLLERPTPVEAARWIGTWAVDEARRSYERLVDLGMPVARRVYEALPRRLRAPLLTATRSLRR